MAGYRVEIKPKVAQRGRVEAPCKISLEKAVSHRDHRENGASRDGRLIAQLAKTKGFTKEATHFFGETKKCGETTSLFVYSVNAVA